MNMYDLAEVAYHNGYNDAMAKIVHCKECKHLYDEADDYCCTSHKGLVKITPDSFCSYGERKV